MLSELDIDRIIEMAVEGVDYGLEQSRLFSAWHSELNNYQITMEASSHLLLQMVRNGVVPVTKTIELVNAYDEEQERYGDTLGAVYNAATQTFREAPLGLTMGRSERLNLLVDNAIDIYPKAA